MRFDDVTGAVLAGGGGTRLGGVRKAFLRRDGEALLARTLRVLRAAFPETLLVANEVAPYALFGAPVVPDPLPGHGAVGGLYAALRASTTDWVFLVGCDMPALDERVIAALARRRTPGTQACIAVVGPPSVGPSAFRRAPDSSLGSASLLDPPSVGPSTFHRAPDSSLGSASLLDDRARPEPLHAFWATAAAPRLEGLLRDGDPSFRDLLESIPHVKVPLEQIEAEVPGAGASFANVNTTEDLARWGVSRPTEDG